MAGAPGTLRVVDEKTVYFRPPPSFLEPDALLMTLRNLLKAAYERELRGEPPPEIKPPPPPKLVSSVRGKAVGPAVGSRERSSSSTAQTTTEAPPKLHSTKVTQQLEKLMSLRDQGILTQSEYETARRRILGE
jgi:hypothetical protein